MSNVTVMSVESKNVMRIKAARVESDGKPMVVIAGNNEQGKSSLLTSMLVTLGVKRPVELLRQGEKKGEVEVLLTNGMKLTVSITPKGFYLKVLTADGEFVANPASALKEMTGGILVDPVALTRMAPDKLVEHVKTILGISTDELDKERDDLFSKRGEANKTARDEEGRLRAMPEGADVERASSVELSERLVEAQATEARLKRALELAAFSEETEAKATDHQARIPSSFEERKQAMLDRQETERSVLDDEYKAAVNLAKEIRDAATVDCDTASAEAAEAAKALIDSAPIRESITKIDATNRLAAEYAAAESQRGIVRSAKGAAKALTDALEEKRESIRSIVGGAKFPVEDMILTERGLEVDGVPFAQCSQAQQLNIAVELGFTAAPELKVLVVRDGSLLDDKHLALMNEIAVKHEGQIWVERVGDRDDGAIIIEDGEVRE